MVAHNLTTEQERNVGSNGGKEILPLQLGEQGVWNGNAHLDEACLTSGIGNRRVSLTRLLAQYLKEIAQQVLIAKNTDIFCRSRTDKSVQAQGFQVQLDTLGLVQGLLSMP